MTEVFVLAAVVSSLDAGLLTAAVVLLGRPRPARQLLAYLIGGMGLSIAFGLLIVLGLHGSKLLRKPSRSTSAVIEVVSGALLIIVAIVVRSSRAVQWHPRRRSHDEAKPSRRPSLYERTVGHDSVWIAWAAGAPLQRARRLLPEQALDFLGGVAWRGGVVVAVAQKVVEVGQGADDRLPAEAANGELGKQRSFVMLLRRESAGTH